MNNLFYLSEDRFTDDRIEVYIELLKRVFLRDPKGGIPYILYFGVSNINKAIVSFEDGNGNAFVPPKDYMRYTSNNRVSDVSFGITYDYYSPEGIENNIKRDEIGWMSTPNDAAVGHFDIWYFENRKVKEVISKIRIRGEQTGKYNSYTPAVYLQKNFIDVANKSFGFEVYAKRIFGNLNFDEELIINKPIESGKFPFPKNINIESFTKF